MVLMMEDGGVAAAASKWRPACTAPGAPRVPLSSKLAWTANSKRIAEVMVWDGRGKGGRRAKAMSAAA